jgi:GT2 family glycosyltransferase
MISVVMAYYNRLTQLRYTLKTIASSVIKDAEIIIVDDFSNVENSLNTIQQEFHYINIKIIHMRDIVPHKNYCNPCIPYNVGFRASSGDKILIQNPECCHVGDVLDHVTTQLNDFDYLTYHCWACTRPDATALHQGKKIAVGAEQGKAKWYNHQVKRPVALHFACAITRKNLIELNGFDESFSMGFNYDDNEFLQRIKHMNLNIKFISDPYVIHQYHSKSYGHPDNPIPTVDNQVLFQHTINSKKIRAENKENICGI